MSSPLPDHDITARKRTAHACDNCRKLKVRCLPSGTQAVCKKCSHSSRRCTFTTQVRNDRNERQSKRISKASGIESKLNGILDLLSQSSHASAQLPSLSADLPLNDGPRPSGMAYQQRESTPAEDGFIADFDECGDAFDMSECFNTYVDWPEKTCHNVDPFGLDRPTTEALLDRFRSMTTYFPFVLLPKDVPVAALAQERPFLYLAALATASSEQPPLQSKLDTEFKQALSQRVVANGERSLDLLQGLLVYLAWYYFHFVPRTQQSYQFLQLAIGMAIDLGLDQPPEDVQATSVDLQVRDDDPVRTREGNFWDGESRRAYLGCYYLSTTICLHNGKPSRFECTPYMIECANSLQQEEETWADQLLVSLFNLQRLAEEIHSIYHMESKGLEAVNSRMRLHTHTKRLKIRLEDWKSKLPASIRCNVQIQNGYHSLNISIYEMGLVYRLERKRTRTSGSLSQSDFLANQNMLMQNLITCVDAANQWFKSFLLVPPSEYGKLPAVEWSRLILSTFVLFRLSLGVPAVPEWDTQIAQESGDLADYLTAILSRFPPSYPSPGPGEMSSSTLFSMLPAMISSMRTAYNIAKDDLYPTDHLVRAHPDLTSRPNARPKGCPSFRHLKPFTPPAVISTMEDTTFSTGPCQFAGRNAGATAVGASDGLQPFTGYLLPDISNEFPLQ